MILLIQTTFSEQIRFDYKSVIASLFEPVGQFRISLLHKCLNGCPEQTAFGDSFFDLYKAQRNNFFKWQNQVSAYENWLKKDHCPPKCIKEIIAPMLPKNFTGYPGLNQFFQKSKQEVSVQLFLAFSQLQGKDFSNFNKRISQLSRQYFQFIGLGRAKQPSRGQHFLELFLSDSLFKYQKGLQFQPRFLKKVDQTIEKVGFGNVLFVLEDLRALLQNLVFTDKQRGRGVKQEVASLIQRQGRLGLPTQDFQSQFLDRNIEYYQMAEKLARMSLRLLKARSAAK